MKVLTFIDVSNPIWYLERSDLKSSSITSSALSLIMISISSLFECSARYTSLSLEDIKLITSNNQIFYGPDFLRHL